MNATIRRATITTVALVLVVSGANAAGQAPQQSGQDLYMEHCAVCHGNDGTGNGPLAPALNQVPSDLTTIARRNGGTYPNDLIYQVIDGTRTTRPPAHGGGVMPIWGERLRRPLQSTMAKINALVAYLEQIQAAN